MSTIFKQYRPLRERTIRFLRQDIEIISAFDINHVKFRLVILYLFLILTSALIVYFVGLTTLTKFLSSNTTNLIILVLPIILACSPYLLAEARFGRLLWRLPEHEMYIGKRSNRARFALPLSDGRYSVYTKSAPCVFDGCTSGMAYIGMTDPKVNTSRANSRRTQNEQQTLIEITNLATCDADLSFHKYFVDNNCVGYPREPQNIDKI